VIGQTILGVVAEDVAHGVGVVLAGVLEATGAGCAIGRWCRAAAIQKQRRVIIRTRGAQLDHEAVVVGAGVDAIAGAGTEIDGAIGRPTTFDLRPPIHVGVLDAGHRVVRAAAGRPVSAVEVDLIVKRLRLPVGDLDALVEVGALAVVGQLPRCLLQASQRVPDLFARRVISQLAQLEHVLGLVVLGVNGVLQRVR